MKRRKPVGWLVDPSGARILVRDKATGEAIRQMAERIRELEAQCDGLMLDFKGCLDALMKLQNAKWTRLGEALRLISVKPSR